MGRAILNGVALTLTLACAGGGPPAPYNLFATTGGGAAEVRWSCDASATLDSFLVQRSEGFNNNFIDVAKVPSYRFAYHDEEVVVGEQYYYRVAAFYTRWNNEEKVLSEFSPEVGVEIK